MTGWFALTLCASFFLGFYGIAKKHAVDGNAVAPVLLANVTTAGLIWGAGILLQGFGGMVLESTLLELSLSQHILLFLKSVLVGTSWMFAFVALKHLPISIATPIRATSPTWTFLLAITLVGERPNMLQWGGVLLILASFLGFSLVGKNEGIDFSRDRSVWLMIAATLISSFSGLYDKYLLQSCGIKPCAVQAWFSVYLVPVMIPMFAIWFYRDRNKTPFHWRWSIPLIAILLHVADYLYFVALSRPDALIAVISPLRRCSIVIPFAFGIIMLKEKSWQPKLMCIAVLLMGAFLVSLA